MKRTYIPKKDYSYDLIVFWTLRDIFTKHFQNNLSPAVRSRSFRTVLLGVYNNIPKAYRGFFKFAYKLAVVLALLPLVIINLIFYYLAFFFYAVKFRDVPADIGPSEFVEVEALFDRLYPKWCYMPAYFILKFEESYLFSREEIASPSMEIGCQYGEHSEKVFVGKKIDVALDCEPGPLSEFTQRAGEIFDKKICGDAYTLPFHAHSLNTILLINSIDDFQRGSESALEEFSRVLKHRGRLVFSLFTKTFQKNSILTKLAPSGTLFDAHYEGVHNFLDIEDVESQLAKANFELSSFKYLVKTDVLKYLEILLILERNIYLRYSFKISFWPLINLPILAKAYKRLLLRLCLSSLSNSGKGSSGGLLYVVATKAGTEESSPRGLDVVCPLCVDEYLAGTEFESASGGHFQFLKCGNCGTIYPILDGIPVLHPEFHDFEGR